MKIHKDMQQKSWQWFKARAGKVTASELKYLVTDGFQLRKWTTEMPNKYLHRKLAEKWRGEALQSFQGNQQTDQGLIYEEHARAFFSSLLESDIQTVGGIESDDGRCWCSPDGLIGSDVGLEIKCPNADTHVGWLLAGGVPDEHVLQVQFSMLISELNHWWFLSYCRDFSHLAVEVAPDDKMVNLICVALQGFNERYEAAFAELVKINGSPPPERKVFVPSPETQADPRADMFQGVPP
jgi:hypothetical protein